jgi:NAD(P)-dependent dehydrogenase (short-subunit alcohol dehydrogenase family)
MKEHRKEPSQSGVLIVGVGASRGLGAAIARRFVRGGHPVTIAGRNTAKLEVTADELKKAGANVGACTRCLSIGPGRNTRTAQARRRVAVFHRRLRQLAG